MSRKLYENRMDAMETIRRLASIPLKKFQLNTHEDMAPLMARVVKDMNGVGEAEDYIKELWFSNQIDPRTAEELLAQIQEDGGDAKFNIFASVKNSVIIYEEEEYAIKEYLSSRSYTINSALRGEIMMTPENQRIVGLIDSALEKIPVYQGVVYRSISSDPMVDVQAFLAMHYPGKIVTYPSYTSASTLIYDDTMDIQLVIHSKTGRDLRKYNPNEQEIIFKRNTQFFVEKKEENTIWLREI